MALPLTDHIPRSGIRSLLQRYATADVVNLASGDPAAATPEHVIEAAHRAATEGMTHYTDVRGLAGVRTAVADKLCTENGLSDVDPDRHVVLTAGAMNGLAATLRAITAPGDEVILLDPSFPNYRAHVLLAGGVPVPVPLRAAAGFLPYEDELRAAITPRTRVLVVNSPNNPTGVVYPADTMRMLVRLTEEYDCWLVSDEAYEHIVFPPNGHVSACSLQHPLRHVISVFSLSKSYAMTGWRAGYVVAPEQVVEAVSRVQEHQLGSLNAPTQYAALAALTGPRSALDAMVAEYRIRRDTVHATLGDIQGIHVVEPQGSFYAFPRTGGSSMDVVSWLAEHAGVLVMPGDCFGPTGDGHLRLSFCGEGKLLDEGCERLGDGLRALPEQLRISTSSA